MGRITPQTNKTSRNQTCESFTLTSFDLTVFRFSESRLNLNFEIKWCRYWRRCNIFILKKHCGIRSFSSWLRLTSTKQLCQQISRTLNLCVNNCGDPIVQSMFLVGVVPAVGSSGLLVHVDCDMKDCDHEATLIAICNQAAPLQFEISRSIHRKWLPKRIFSVSATSHGGSNE